METSVKLREGKTVLPPVSPAPARAHGIPGRVAPAQQSSSLLPKGETQHKQKLENKPSMFFLLPLKLWAYLLAYN